MQYQSMRDEYLKSSMKTASPAIQLTMIYDRLISDLTKSEAALAKSDFQTSNDFLLHAQEIIVALKATLQVDIWPAGEQLDALYEFLLSELVQANIYKDLGKVTSCKEIIEPLSRAWHIAAQEVTNKGSITEVKSVEPIVVG